MLTPWRWPSLRTQWITSRADMRVCFTSLVHLHMFSAPKCTCREHHGLAFPLPRELDPLPWPPAPAPTACHKQQLGLAWAKCSTGVLKDIPGGSQLIFERLFAWGEHTFWLDRYVWLGMLACAVGLHALHAWPCLPLSAKRASVRMRQA